MPNSIAGIALILAACIQAPLCAQAESHFQWKAGAAKVKITPTESMWLAGYASRVKPFDRVLEDLWAKTLVIEDDRGNRLVLITLDLIGIDARLSDEICARLQSQHSLTRSQIVLATSHTHTGPVVGKNLGAMHFYQLSKSEQNKVQVYSDSLQERILECVAQAFKQIKPAYLKWGSGVATFATNRRNNPEPEVQRLRHEKQLNGPVDHSVPVLAAMDEAGKPVAIVFGYACHATVLSSYEVSGDYPGFAQRALEESHPGSIAMFWAGCGADQNPLPRRTVALAEHYGRRLAGAVDEVLMTTEMPIVRGRIQHNYRKIALPLSKLPARPELESQAISSNKYEAMRAKLLLEKIKAGESLSETYSYPVQCWAVGEQVDFVFLGGEVVVDYAIELKSKLRKEQTWVASYSNDVMAYIPSRRVLREGGYEGATSMLYYGLPTIWASDVEALIVGEVARQFDLFSRSAQQRN